MRIRGVWLGLAVVGFSMGSGSAALAASTWREVRSPHFNVVTDGSSKDGRAVANDFEEMRHVFAVRFKNDNVETGAPLTILAIRDENNLKQMGANFYKDRDRIAGEFFPRWERQFALVRLDSFGDRNEVVIFHEYTHAVMHANLHWMATWLDEGLAEFYAYTRFQNDRIYVGAPSVRLGQMGQNMPIPMEKMLTVTNATYASDPEMADRFYAESWAVVHFLIFSKDMGEGAKLAQFLQLTESGMDQTKAFLQVFGSFKAFDTGFRLYMSHFTLAAGVLPPDKGLDPKTFDERTLSAAETNLYLGSMAAGAHDQTAARTLLEKALAADDGLAGAHEELGFIDYVQGRDEDAAKQWKQAVTLDPKLYRSAFALLMTGTPVARQTTEELHRTQAALQGINALEPKFAAAYVELALVELRIGQVLQAYRDALHGEQLAPWRAGYHLLVGHILLAGQQPKEAAKYAHLVAARWPGPDHNEAVDLWSTLPAAARDEGPALTLDLPPGTQIMRGTIVSSSCDAEAKHGGVRLQVQPEGASATAAPLSLTADRPNFGGFSDTLWFGSDHVTPCYHLAGLNTLMAYRADPKGGRTVLYFEVRDPWPAVRVVSPAEAKSPASGAATQP